MENKAPSGSGGESELSTRKPGEIPRTIRHAVNPKKGEKGALGGVLCGRRAGDSRASKKTAPPAKKPRDLHRRLDK